MKGYLSTNLLKINLVKTILKTYIYIHQYIYLSNELI